MTSVFEIGGTSQSDRVGGRTSLFHSLEPEVAGSVPNWLILYNLTKDIPKVIKKIK